MQRILTHDELKAALQSAHEATIPSVLSGMIVAAAVVEGEAKRNCTPGHSPYEDMVFPTKLAKYQREGKFKKIRLTSRPSVFVAYEGAYSGAPYSLDWDPHRRLIHMRDTIYSGADADQSHVYGFVGTPVDYSGYVHEGTSKMWGRPFLTDAIMAKQRQVRQIIGEALFAGIMDKLGIDRL